MRNRAKEAEELDLLAIARYLNSLANVVDPNLMMFADHKPKALALAHGSEVYNGIECDWGGCSKRACALRKTTEPYLKSFRLGWIPVCREHCYKDK